MRNEINGEENLSRNVGISFAIHALFISFFILKAAFFDSEPIDFTQAIRVDMVGLPSKFNELPTRENSKPSKNELPDKAKEVEVNKVDNLSNQKAEELKKVELPPKEALPKTEVKNSKLADPEGVRLEKAKVQQQSAFEKLKSMAALDKIKNEVNQENSRIEAEAGKSKAGESKLKGNVISPGTALSGLSKLEHDSYAANLDHHIKEHWSLPQWLANRNFKAQAKVYFDSRGVIVGRKIVKSSGNQNYDDEVIATIDRSSPFPPPPEKFVSIVEQDGILIGFPE